MKVGVISPWLVGQAEMLRCAPTAASPTCVTHPDGHGVSECNTSFGPMWLFNTDEYSEPTYCMGDDDVSRTLRRIGTWEPVESAMFRSVLSSDAVVIDFGSQVGWYSRMAAAYGCHVLALEAADEHATLTQRNCPDATVVRMWVDDSSPVLGADGAPRITCVKMDLEGAEVHAVRMISALLDADLIDNILMEVSPVFNDTYPGIVRDLMGRGFTAEVCNPHQPFTFDEVDAVVAQAPQVEMMFRKVSL